MREALFIKKNKDRWEKMAYMPEEDIDEVANEFTQLVDDLGYSKTFYPTSKTTTFLNTEASKRYLTIYNNRKESKNKLVQFVTYDVPMTIYKHRIVMISSLVIFIMFYAVGFYSAIKDESMVADMLSPGYVKDAEKNIADGNPFGIYQRDNNVLMFLGIMINNISVAFRYFAQGIIFPFTTIPQMVQEGIRIGAFNALFAKQGMAGKFVLAVFIHGTLELFSIIVAAASGVILGLGWIFPGKNPRLKSFVQGAKDGVKILVSIVPMLVIAAWFEGFVTRYYNILKLWANLSILIGSLSIIIGYYVIYPIIVHRKYKNVINEDF